MSKSIAYNEGYVVNRRGKDSLALLKHEMTHMMTALFGVTVQGQWVSHLEKSTIKQFLAGRAVK